MDTLAHALWTNAAFYKKYENDSKNRWFAILFGVLPDLISFAPLFIYRFFFNSKIDIFDISAPLVRYANESYNYTHSLVVWSVVFFSNIYNS